MRRPGTNIETQMKIVYNKQRDPTESATPLILKTETDPVSETLCSLIFRIPDDGQRPKTPAIPIHSKVHLQISLHLRPNLTQNSE
jgi:hypothetical protein